MNEVAFPNFLKLLPDIQNKIFNFSTNKTNLQHINKEWCQNKSIKNKDVFSYVTITAKKIREMLFTAKSLKNEDGVKNIIEIFSESIGRSELLYYKTNYFVDKKPAILCYHGNIHFAINATNINFDCCISNDLAIGNNIFPSPLVMACFTGNYEKVTNILLDNSITSNEINIALQVSMDLEKINYCNLLINDKKFQWQTFLTHEILRKACSRKDIKAVKMLLTIGTKKGSYEFLVHVLNKIGTVTIKNRGTSEVTLLDFVLDAAKKESEFFIIAQLLHKNGALQRKDFGPGGLYESKAEYTALLYLNSTKFIERCAQICYEEDEKKRLNYDECIIL